MLWSIANAVYRPCKVQIVHVLVGLITPELVAASMLRQAPWQHLEHYVAETCSYRAYGQPGHYAES